MIPELVVLIPIHSRPQNIPPLLDSLADNTPVGLSRVVLIDVERDGYRERWAEPRRVSTWGSLDVHLMTIPDLGRRAEYARKINAGYRATTEPFIFTGADDLRFHPGWWEAARQWFEKPHIGVVGTNDLGNPMVKRGKASTHSVVRREYADLMGTIDGPGAIYVEAYPHEFVDDEMIGTARSRHAFVSARDSHVEHLHPSWGKAPTDELYDAAPERLAAGRKIFRARESLWNRPLPRFQAGAWEGENVNG